MTNPAIPTIEVGDRFTTNYHGDIVLTEYAVGGYIAQDAETVVLRELRVKHKNPRYVFDGCTECFLDVDRAWLINRVEEELRNGR